MLRFILIPLICMVMTSNLVTGMENPEPLVTRGENVIAKTVKTLSFSANLNDLDRLFIYAALSSQNDTLARAGLKAVVAHQLTDCADYVSRGVGPDKSVSRLLSGLVEAFIKAPADMRLKFIIDKIESFIGHEECDNLRIELTEALLMLCAREVRQGKPIPIPTSFALTQQQKELLRFSQMKENESISTLITQMTSAKMAGIDEYGLVQILSTYGVAGMNAAIEVLLNAERMDKCSIPGRALILACIDPYGNSMPISAIKSVYEIMENNHFRTKYFSQNATLKNHTNALILRLKERLAGGPIIIFGTTMSKMSHTLKYSIINPGEESLSFSWSDIAPSNDRFFYFKNGNDIRGATTISKTMPCKSFVRLAPGEEISFLIDLLVEPKITTEEISEIKVRVYVSEKREIECIGKTWVGNSESNMVILRAPKYLDEKKIDR